MTDTTRRALLAASGASATLAAVPQALAQVPAGYPNRAVKIIVGFAPGGLTDAYARLFAEQFTARFNQPCVVENRPGAGANIAIEAVVKAPPDGYTFLATTTGAVWQNRVLYRKLPFDLAKDIDPVCIFPAGPLVAVLPEKLNVRTWDDMVACCRKTRGTIGSLAPSSGRHILSETTYTR